MKRYLLRLILCLAAASTPASSATETVSSEILSDEVLMSTLRHIDAGLRSAQPVRISKLLTQISASTGKSETEIRSHLLTRLERLRSLRTASGEGWDRLLESRGPLSERQVSRWFDHLERGLRTILTSGDDYLLDTHLRFSARKARIPAAEALQFTNRLLARQLTQDPLAAEVEPVGVVVNGWTEKYDYKLDPLLIYLDTEDEAVIREAVRDIQRFIVPGVVRGLPAAPGVAWAFRQRDLTALVDPVYDIRLRVRSLRFTGLTTNLRPCIDLGIDILSTASGQSVLTDDVHHCTQLDATSANHRLGPFFDEVASLVTDTIAAHLAALR